MSEEPEAEVADEETDEEETGGLQEGDFVHLDYTVRTVEDDEVIDTTDVDVALEEGIDTDDREFEPQTIVLGEGHIFESVEDAILGEEVGYSGTETIPAEEAFGEHDPEQVETVSTDKIPEQDRYPGAQVNVDGDQGRLETIVGGRARVDFNHPLAGEDIEYEYEVVEQVEDRVEQAEGLVAMFIEADLDMHIETDEVEEETTVEPDDEDGEPETEIETVEKETLYIESTPQLAMDQQWMFQKQQIAQTVMDQLDLDRVIIQETIDGSGGRGPMGGMMGGGDLEEQLDDADVDEEEIVEELEETEDAESDDAETEE